MSTEKYTINQRKSMQTRICVFLDTYQKVSDDSMSAAFSAVCPADLSMDAGGSTLQSRVAIPAWRRPFLGYHQWYHMCMNTKYLGTFLNFQINFSPREMYNLLTKLYTFPKKKTCFPIKIHILALNQQNNFSTGAIWLMQMWWWQQQWKWKSHEGVIWMLKASV